MADDQTKHTRLYWTNSIISNDLTSLSPFRFVVYVSMYVIMCVSGFLCQSARSQDFIREAKLLIQPNKNLIFSFKYCEDESPLKGKWRVRHVFTRFGQCYYASF